MPTIRTFNKRLETLRGERTTFLATYRDLSDYHLAHRGRFLTSDRNKGHKRNLRQYNNTSRLAVRTLASGMMSGITSPARPWFELSAGPDLDSITSVKEWMHRVQSIIYRVFNSSNLYNSLHTLYAELGVFGTGAMGVFEDFENVIWCKPYTVGAYMLGADGKNNIDTFYREYELTVGAVIKQFGYENCSLSTRQMWDTGNTESWVKIIHATEPNDDRDGNSPLARDKVFRSVYYEQMNVGNREVSNRDAGPEGSAKFLRESGFDDFPFMTPRWDITGEDIYGTSCPGMDSIGDTKALQLGEKRKYQAVDKVANPPLQGPTSLRNKIPEHGLGPDETVWSDNANEQLSSIYGNYRPDINAIMAVNNESEMRIKRAFYEDLFLMIASSDRRQVTAREIAEKQEEKLIMLGPVLERLHTELLDPLIDRTFNILQRSGVLPPPPPELDNQEINVKYVSLLAQAQRLVAVGGLERVTGFAANLAAVWPEARHKVDAMQAIDEYAESVGVNPRVVRANDDAQDQDAQEKAQAAAAQAQAAASQAADTAKTMSEVDTQSGNGLTDMMRQAGLA